jgi:hypothetical protein
MTLGVVKIPLSATQYRDIGSGPTERTQPRMVIDSAPHMAIHELKFHIGTFPSGVSHKTSTHKSPSCDKYVNSKSEPFCTVNSSLFHVSMEASWALQSYSDIKGEIRVHLHEYVS